MCSSAWSETIHYEPAYAFLSTPKYPAGFSHFDYVNPRAPKGGRIRVAEMGTWDSFNPISEKGRLAGGLGFWAVDQNLLWDTLMVPSLDEPATEYGLLAKGIAVAKDGSWVAFKLRKNARWHDGTPITVADVVFTFNAIQNDSSPTIMSSFEGFKLQVIGPRQFRFIVPKAMRGDPEIPLRLGGIPIFCKHYWASRDISKTTVQPPLGSGPYKIGKFRIGHWVEFDRVKHYWGANLAVNRGKYNFDIVRYEYFRDDQVQTEAAKADVIDVMVENVPRTWYASYNIPAVQQGYLKKVVLRLSRPAGLWWPVFWNMSEKRFQDIRVRKALWLLDDMVWFNRHSYGFWGAATSFFQGSELASRGLPGPRELKLLEPLRNEVPPSVFTKPYTSQPHAGNGWSRANLLEANKLLDEAGWVVRDGKRVYAKTGEPFFIRFVAVSPALGASFIAYTHLLKRLGIGSSIKSPEISNWLYRMESGDFDAGAVWFLPSYTPTLLIKNSFYSTNADKPYGSNWSNLKDPAIDRLIDDMGAANTWPDYVAAIRAFDRVMLHNYYWLPMMSKTKQAVAYWDRFGIPKHGRLSRLAYIDLWWWDKKKALRIDKFSRVNQ